MLTVAVIEETIESRVGGFVAQVREITEDSTKPSILESASWALRRLGYDTSSVLTITDAEAEAVTDADVDVTLDLVELRVLTSLPGNLPAVDFATGPQNVKMSTLLPALENIIARRKRDIETEHGRRISGTPYRRARLVLPTVE